MKLEYKCDIVAVKSKHVECDWGAVTTKTGNMVNNNEKKSFLLIFFASPIVYNNTLLTVYYCITAILHIVCHLANDERQP